MWVACCGGKAVGEVGTEEAGAGACVDGFAGGAEDVAKGYPQWGHCGAADETCLEHSGQEIKAIRSSL